MVVGVMAASPPTRIVRGNVTAVGRLSTVGQQIVVTWRYALIAVWAVVNGVLIGYAFEAFLLRPDSGNDWGTWHSAAAGLSNGTLYADGIYVWSPIAAWLFGAIVLPLGYWFWFAAHLAVVGLLRSKLLIVAVLTSGPFWIDTVAGNFFTFVVVAGYLALRGSRAASLVFLALCLLMPRPIQLPLVAWLLVRDRGLWLPTLAMTAASLGLAWDHLTAWADALLNASRHYPFRGWDLGPTRFLGTAWLIVGAPLGMWLTLKGRLGLAGMAMSPYLVPQYLLWAILEWPSRGALSNEKPKD